MIPLLIGTQINRAAGVRSLCRINRFNHTSGWQMWLNDEVQDWAREYDMTYDYRITNQWWVELTIHDPRLATLFKLTWL